MKFLDDKVSEEMPSSKGKFNGLIDIDLISDYHPLRKELLKTSKDREQAKKVIVYEEGTYGEYGPAPYPP